MKIGHRLLMLLFLAGVSATIAFAWNSLKPATVPDTPLVSRRVTPVAQIVRAKSMESVDLTWEVRNQTTEPMRGLRAQTDCQCRIREAFPAVLNPGEAARVSIRLNAPNAGAAQRSLPVFCENMQVPVGKLQVAFQVDVKAPFWLQPPKMLRLQGVVGKNRNARLPGKALSQRQQSGSLMIYGLTAMFRTFRRSCYLQTSHGLMTELW